MFSNTQEKSVRVSINRNVVDFTAYVHVWTEGDKETRQSIRVRIHVDGYVDQSYGVVERWSGERWTEVATIKGAALNVDLNLSSRATEAAFNLDYRRLMALASEVL